MAKINFAIIKKHPYITAAVAVVVFIIVYFLVSGRSSSVAATTGGNSAAQIAADAQTQQLNAQLSAQNNQNSFQLAYLQQQQVLAGAQGTQAYNLGVSNLADQLTIAQQQLATQLATTQITTSAGTQQLQDQLTAQVTINNQNNQTAVAQQAILANEQAFSIAAQSQVESLISNNQTLVANNQINAGVSIANINAGVTKYIAKTNAGSQQSSSIFGFLGAIAGAIL